jgi:hypothetical protein
MAVLGFAMVLSFIFSISNLAHTLDNDGTGEAGGVVVSQARCRDVRSWYLLMSVSGAWCALCRQQFPLASETPAQSRMAASCCNAFVGCTSLTAGSPALSLNIGV